MIAQKPTVLFQEFSETVHDIGFVGIVLRRVCLARRYLRFWSGFLSFWFRVLRLSSSILGSFRVPRARLPGARWSLSVILRRELEPEFRRKDDAHVHIAVRAAEQSDGRPEQFHGTLIPIGMGTEEVLQTGL